MAGSCGVVVNPQVTLGGSAVLESDTDGDYGSFDATVDALGVGCSGNPLSDDAWGAALIPDWFYSAKVSASVGGDFYDDSSKDAAYGGGGFRLEAGYPLVIFGVQTGVGLDLLNTGLRLPISAGIYFGSKVRVGLNTVVTPQWNVFDQNQFKLGMGGNLSLSFETDKLLEF